MNATVLKRRLLIAAVFLLAGAVVNVAVAWGCVRWSQPSAKTIYAAPLLFTEDRIYWLAVTRSDGFGAAAQQIAAVVKLVHRGEVAEEFETITLLGHDGERHVPVRTPPGWTRVGGWTLADGTGLFIEDEAVWGWPLKCLWRVGAQKRIQAGHWSDMKNSRHLPRALWTGFAVNSLFYAAVLWLLIPGPFAMRRFIRMKRGLCVKCAYPMGESGVCSECGKALPDRAAQRIMATNE